MKKKICFVVADPSTAHAFLRDHIQALSQQYAVYLAAHITSGEQVQGLALEGWKSIDIERGMSPAKDLRAVWQLKRYFREMQFDAVHSVTPKAGLVSALAGKMAGIRHRTHVFTGQVWCTRKGPMRWLLKSIDKIIVRLDNHILVDGKSQRAFLVREGVLKEGEALVFAQGSISGANVTRFAPDATARKEIRARLGIKDATLCFLFLGRLNRDKGIGELFEAFNRPAEEEKNVFLLLVGPDEGGYARRADEYRHLVPGKNYCYFGRTEQPEKLLNAGDVLVLPTYREGFGTSVIEAACVGLPCICSDAYGVLDAYIEGETGLRCQVGDVRSLYDCMKQMCANPALVGQMGQKSRDRALRDFSGERLTECWKEFYQSLLSGKTE